MRKILIYPATKTIVGQKWLHLADEMDFNLLQSIPAIRSKINPAENISVSIVAMGEGWHNYHHVFPWDYKAAELAHRINITTFWIQFFAKLGWAYDLKEPTPELVRRTIEKCGTYTINIYSVDRFQLRMPMFL